ncbi:hypothetical protein FRC10_009216 [Ceratobasidium sp. 414]|nr:hypothetical protein FRC10_009216 [Ceratobasidium sp. 414]
MGDSCTGVPTFTSFSASTEQTFSVSQSTSQSFSILDPSVISSAVTISGTDVSLALSTVPGATSTINIIVPVTVPAQHVVSVPVLTLFAPCSTSETPSSSSTPTPTPGSSSTPTSSSTETTPTSESRTSDRNTRTSENTSANPPASSTGRQNSAPTPTSTSPGSNNNPSETGTIFTTTSLGFTTLPNGSQSTFIATVTTSVAPNGSLNNNDRTAGGGGAGSSRAVAIGVGVAGGVIALIILIMGITWHIRRKRRASLELGLGLGLDESHVWAPTHERKSPDGSTDSRTRPAVIPEYTFNPYSEARTTSYAPVPTMSPPRPRTMSLGGHTPQASVSSSGNGGLTVAPMLVRTKTADEILYEAAREGLPRSRTTSVTASQHTRGYGSLTASSHLTHGGRSDSVIGLLEAHGGNAGGHGLDEIGRRMYASDVEEEERPMSPISIAVPRLAITNPDADKDP